MLTAIRVPLQNLSCPMRPPGLIAQPDIEGPAGIVVRDGDNPGGENSTREAP